MHRGQSDLPAVPADRFTVPFARFLKIEAATGLLLALAAGAALALSNSPWAEPFLAFWETQVAVSFGSLDFSRSLRHWINDGLMTLFFFVVALELKRALVRGELRHFRIAAFSFAGALGGMVVPACVYLAVIHGEAGTRGLGTVMATDTAFLMGGLAVLGRRVPSALRLFLLSLAIFDDVGAILVVAVGYGDPPRWTALAVVVGILMAIFGAARVGIRSVPVYALLGASVWFAFDASGIHPTVAGVVLGLMTPAKEWVSSERLHKILERVLSSPTSDGWSNDAKHPADLRRAHIAAKEALSPGERLEMLMHPWSGFVIMPVFALANAGVRLSWTHATDPVFAAVFAGLVVGKPAGVIAVSWLAVRIGAAVRPPDLGWSVLAGGALLTGIGFTMSLFIAGLAFSPGMLEAAKIAILSASIVSGAAGLLVLRWLTAEGRQDSNPLQRASGV